MPQYPISYDSSPVFFEFRAIIEKATGHHRQMQCAFATFRMKHCRHALQYVCDTVGLHKGLELTQVGAEDYAA